ncbi:HV330 protein, partial [Amia calva]|nr:HV330 protein [Amia calva]
YNIGWVPQAPGQGLDWVPHISYWAGTTKRYAQAVLGRFTIFRDNAKSMLYSQMNSLKTEYSTTYNCARN